MAENIEGRKPAKKPVSSELSTEFIESKVKEVNDSYVNKYFFVKGDNKDKYPPFEILTSIRYDPNIQRSDDTDGSSVFFLFDEHLKRLNFQLSYFKWEHTVPREFFLEKLKHTVQLLEERNGVNQSPYKLRVTIDANGECNVEASEAIHRPNLLDGLNISIVPEPDLSDANNEIISMSNSSQNLYYINDQIDLINDSFLTDLIKNSYFLSDSLSADLTYNIYIDTQPTEISCFTSFKTTYRDHYNDARRRILNNSSDYSIRQDVLLYNHLGQVMECSISNVAFKRHKTTLSTGKVEEIWVTPSIVTGCLCGTVRHMLLSKGLMKEGIVSLKDVKKGEEILYFNGIIGVAKGVIL